MTILILAVVGILLNILGRIMILRDDKALSESSRPWVAFCPGAELVFLILRWEHARTGAGLCAVSMALAMPLVGQVSLLSKKPAEGSNAPMGAMAAFTSLFKEQRAPLHSGQQKADTNGAVKAKAEKVEKLRRYLAEWYALLCAKEPYLCSELPDETAEFNRSAAAYHRLLDVSKQEAAELARLQPTLAVSTQDEKSLVR